MKHVDYRCEFFTWLIDYRLRFEQTWAWRRSDNDPRHISEVARNTANCHRYDDNRHSKHSCEGDSGREIPDFSKLYQIHEAKHGTLDQVKQQRALTKLHRDKASYSSRIDKSPALEHRLHCYRRSRQRASEHKKNLFS
nr:hypothetical protein [Mesorhizobium sp. 131-2-5]